ncbi:MAG: FtsX-like permease family protein [Candidatus Nanopelagicales bacterium]
MYPEITPILALGLGIALAVVGYLVVFRPVLRRLALRQVVRRPTESVLVVLGSVVGTALIVGSLSVGDSLDRSVREAAYDVLGPVDESVSSPSVVQGDAIAAAIAPLAADPRVDGVLTLRGDRAAALSGSDDESRAEPRAVVWEVDFEAARGFGAPHPSGLAVPDPGSGAVVVNQNLAESLALSRGDVVTLYLFGTPTTFTVADVIPAAGLGGYGFGAASNSTAYVSSGTLTAAGAAAGREPTTVTVISNRGDVEGGASLSADVAAAVQQRLDPLDLGTAVMSPKREVLDNAEETGNVLGSVFLFIASYSVIAGVLLIMNIFVMLAEERKGQLGILRAIGLRRRRVTGEFAIEGAIYSAAAAIVGAVLGVLVGRLVVALAVQIFQGWDTSGENSLTVVFDITWTSILNGAVAGFLIAFLAVVLTSVRIARTNIIAAIRDLPSTRPLRTRRRWTVLSAAATAVLVVAAIPAVVSSAGYETYLLPTLALLAAIPLLRRLWPARTVSTVVGFAVLAWGLGANLVRPAVFDDKSTATYVVLGTMVSFAAVLLVSLHQRALLRPLRPLIERPSQAGLATRLAVSYPTAKGFRTAATLAMYTIVVFIIVLLTEISAVVAGGVDQAVDDASGSWSARADYNATNPISDPESLVISESGSGVRALVPLTTTDAEGDDPLGRTSDSLPVTVVGLPAGFGPDAPAFHERLPAARDDAALWRMLEADPSLVVVDAFYGSTGGPQGEPIRPGDRISLTDPRTGITNTRTVAGVLADGTAFYGVGSGGFRYPVLMSHAAQTMLFGTDTQPSSMLIRVAPGVDVDALANRLQADYLENGMVVTNIRATVESSYAASNQFFQLMQGFLALGLLVGVVGLGVVMIRAVRERRRTIAVLRALGFQPKTVQWSFLNESMLIAVEGTVIGTSLGVLTCWLLFLNSPVFGSISGGFPIAWAQIALTVGLTLVASLVITVAPARRAARIRPAVALRIAD